MQGSQYCSVLLLHSGLVHLLKLVENFVIEIANSEIKVFM